MKLVKNKKVVPIRTTKAKVQNVLKQALARNEYKKVLIVGEDKDGYLSIYCSDMRPLEVVGLAEYACAAAMKTIFEP